MPLPQARAPDHAFAALQPGSLSQSITLEYGPIDLLGRYFPAAEAAARNQGVRLSFAGFDELVAANMANSSSWKPIIPSFDPRYSRLEPDTAFCVLGYDEKGDVVATQAVRLFDWTKTTFPEETCAMRLFYEDPERSKRPGEQYIVTARKSEQITGRVLFSGAGWYRPDYRGRGLVELLCRITRAYAYTRWHTDYTCCVMAEGVVKGGLAAKAAYPKIDWEVLMIDSPVAPGASIRAAVLWMDSEHMLADLEASLARLEPEIDATIDNRCAQDRHRARR